MLLTIHNLPFSSRYIDVKSLLEEKCGLTELILDNLVPEGKTKKVTVGLADEGDAAILVRKINGLYVQGLQLYVEDKRKKKESDQPYRSSSGLMQEAQFQTPVVNAHHNMMGEVMAASMNNPMMMNYNMLGMPMYMPMIPTDQNIPFMGYGGPQAGPVAEPRLPAPVHDERGYAGLRGMGSVPGDRSLDREQERDTFRPSDRNRRLSPERPAEPFNRSSRWNENPAPIDMPMRRDKSPPHQPWAPRETYAPLPPLRQPNLPGPRDQNRYQPRQSKPEYLRTDPQWERPTRWDAEPNLQRCPEPEQEWGPGPKEDWQPEPNRAWDEPNRAWNEPNQHWEEPKRQWEENLPRFDPKDDRRQFRDEYPLDQSRNKPNVWNESGHSNDPIWDEGNNNNHCDRNLAPNSLGKNNWERREERGPPVSLGKNQRHDPKPPSSNYNKEWRDDKRPNPWKRTEPERERQPKNWKQVANDYPPAKKQKPDFPRREGFVAPWQNDNKNQYGPIKNANPHQLPFRKVPEETQLQHSPIDNPKPPRPVTIKYLINKDQTVRGQATAILAKEAMVGSKLTDQFSVATILKQLKLCIKGRIEVMLGEELKTDYEEIIAAYRVKFPKKDDKHFYQTIRDRCIMQMKEEVKNKKSEENKKREDENKKREEQNKKREEQNKKREEQNIKKEEQNKKGDEEKTAAVKVKEEPSDKVASAEEKTSEKEKSTAKEKSPQHFVTEAKEQYKLEFTKEDYFKLDPITDKALDEELDKLNEIFASECGDPQDDVDKTICGRITVRSADELRKCIRLHVTKRVLNISTGLTVRIFGEGKLPKKQAIKKYLLPYRVDRLSKNKKGTMYVANIGRFEDYDALCRLEHDVIEGVPMTFKSMHLVGPPPRITRNQVRQRRRQFIQSQIAQATDPEFTLNEESMVDFAADDFAEDINIDNIRDEDLEDF